MSHASDDQIPGEEEDATRGTERISPATLVPGAPETRPETILKRIADGVIIFDNELRYRYLNPQAERALGKSLEEVLGKTIGEASPELIGSKFDVMSRRALQDRAPARFEEYHPRYGTWTEMRLYPFQEGLTIYTSDISERKRTAEGRSESRHYESLVNSIDGIVWELDRQTSDKEARSLNFTFVSRQAEAILGYPVESWLNEPNFLYDHMHPDDRERAVKFCMETSANGTDYRLEFRMIAADGRVVWLRDHFNVEVIDADLAHLRGVMVDITESKHAEASVRESQERLALTLDAARMGMWDWNLLTNEVHWSDDQYRILGVDRDQFGGTYASFINLVHPADRASIEAAIKLAVESVSDFEIEFRLNVPDESPRWFLGKGRAYPDRSGKASRMAGINLDITARKNAEKNLRESEARLRSLVLATSQMVWRGDSEGVNTEVLNWDEITGRTELDPTGDSWLDALHPDDRAATESAWKEAVRNKSFFEKEYRLQHGDGSYHHYISRGIPVFEGGAVREWIGTCIDITERMRLEEQFRQSQKMEAVGQLAAGVAHDFNNILTAITGYSDLALRQIKASTPIRRNVEEIRNAANRAASLIRQLLAFSRRQDLQPKVVDLNEVIEDSGTMLRRLIGANVEMHIQLQPRLDYVLVDQGQIEQVLLNLVLNARDAMPNGGKLTVKTTNISVDDGYTNHHMSLKPGRYVVLDVTDTGTGIDEKIQEHVFEPFFTTKEPGKGTGLGLSTVYGIVEQSGGSISVDSEVGRGTTFKIYLPRAEERVGVEEENNEAAIPQGAETVLLVEDDSALRGLEQEILELFGYRVMDAASADEALRISESYEGEIHLLITDVVMPGLSGRQLEDRIRRLYPGIKVLFVSGYTNGTDINHVALNDRGNFLQKPFTPDALAIKLREVLDK